MNKVLLALLLVASSATTGLIVSKQYEVDERIIRSEYSCLLSEYALYEPLLNKLMTGGNIHRMNKALDTLGLPKEILVRLDKYVDDNNRYYADKIDITPTVQLFQLAEFSRCHKLAKSELF